MALLKKIKTFSRIVSLCQMCQIIKPVQKLDYMVYNMTTKFVVEFSFRFKIY